MRAQCLGLHILAVMELAWIEPATTATAFGSMIYTAQNSGRIIDFQLFTKNPSNVAVTYFLLEFPAKGDLFKYQESSNVVQGSQLCCPPTVLSSSKIYFVPGPDEYGQIYGFIKFAVLESSLLPINLTNVQSLSSLWSSASLQLNVTQNIDAPFAGAAGGMLYFDGLDDFAVMRTETFPTERFTISLWLKGEKTRPEQTVFTLFSTSGRELELSDLMDLRVLRGSDSATASAGIFLADGRWHFVAVTWASGYVKLFVDGEVAPHLSSPPPPRPAQHQQPRH
jgi:hypothetical protein